MSDQDRLRSEALLEFRHATPAADTPPPVTVTFADQDRTVRAPAGSNLRLLSLKSGAKLHNVHTGPIPGAISNCRGHGLCGTCVVEILAGMENLKPAQKNGFENFSLVSGPLAGVRAKEWKLEADRSKYRLACQVKVMGDVTLRAVYDSVPFLFE